MRSFKAENEAIMATSLKEGSIGHSGHALEKPHERQRNGSGRLEHQDVGRGRLPATQDEVIRPASKRKKRRRGR